jgi:hypothetical protein
MSVREEPGQHGPPDEEQLHLYARLSLQALSSALRLIQSYSSGERIDLVEVGNLFTRLNNMSGALMGGSGGDFEHFQTVIDDILLMTSVAPPWILENQFRPNWFYESSEIPSPPEE